MRYTKWKPGEDPIETKNGSYIFGGIATDFHEWEFRTKVRIAAVKKDNDDDRRVVVSKIIEGLRGDAFQVAKDIGLDKLTAAGGIDTLIENLRTITFPMKRHEAEELFAQGMRPTCTTS